MRKMRRKKKTEIEFEIGSDNIFADLGLDDVDDLYTRAALGVQVLRILRERRYSQKEAAEFLGIKQPEVSAIMRAKFDRFSQERLIGFLNKLNQKVTIEVSRHEKGEPYQRVTVAG
jgi:predicted XRE-type DNA-binding protein